MTQSGFVANDLPRFVTENLFFGVTVTCGESFDWLF